MYFPLTHPCNSYLKRLLLLSALLSVTGLFAFGFTPRHVFSYDTANGSDTLAPAGSKKSKNKNKANETTTRAYVVNIASYDTGVFKGVTKLITVSGKNATIKVDTTARAAEVLTAINAPVYVLDGKVISDKEMQQVNPADIAKVTVLSGTEAAAYGGPNAIAITTRKATAEATAKAAPVEVQVKTEDTPAATDTTKNNKVASGYADDKIIMANTAAADKPAKSAADSNTATTKPRPRARQSKPRSSATTASGYVIPDSKP
ncbi:hypothetical protein [Deminuibacter soli]|nr:hypothetical protein [Deminuibacter soli]